jgi:hypothetical protein
MPLGGCPLLDLSGQGCVQSGAMGRSPATADPLLVNSVVPVVYAVDVSVMTVHVNCSIGNGHVHGRVVLEPLQAVAEGAGIETRAAGRQTGTFAVL